MCLHLGDRNDPSEIKRTFRVSFGTFGPIEWPEGSGRVRGAGFTLWLNTPWASVVAVWNTEEQGHDYLRDGIVFSWGRNKGWSVRRESFYRHTCTFMSRLKLNPTQVYPDGEGLKLFRANREISKGNGFWERARRGDCPHWECDGKLSLQSEEGGLITYRCGLCGEKFMTDKKLPVTV